MVLTEKRIRDAKPGESGQYILWDRDGLGLKVGRSVKTYFIVYRVAGRQRRASLGRVGALSLAEARRRAAAMLDQVRLEGVDPLEARRERQEAPTVAEAFDRYFADHVPHRLSLGRMTPRTVENYRVWTKHIYQSIGNLKVADVEQHHIERAVGGLPAVTRNRVLSVARSVFNVFERWGLRPRNSNPVTYIERATEQPRDRTLSPSEMGALSRALNDLAGDHPASVAAIRVAALSGLRIGEVLAIEWQHVSLETGALVIPESKTGGRIHTLPQTALTVIATMPRVNSFVFTSADGRDAHITYKTARTTFLAAAKAAGLEDVRLHDLRRSAITLAAASGVGVAVIRDLLGHKTNAAAWRYVRHTGQAVVEARENLGDRVAEMMNHG